MKSFLSKSDKDTKKIAQNLVKKGKFRIIGLTGELGAGKTTFTQGFAQGLGIKDKIISPTFVLIRQYEIVRQHKIPNTKKTFYHVDLYRLEKLEDIKHLGIEEIMKDPNNIVMIEWAEKMKNILPRGALLIYFEKLDNEKRKIEIKTLS